MGAVVCEMREEVDGRCTSFAALGQEQKSGVGIAESANMLNGNSTVTSHFSTLSRERMRAANTARATRTASECG
jgi:hypothetical protein